MNEQPEGQDDQAVNDEMASLFDLKKRKKKKKTDAPKAEETTEATAVGGEGSAGAEAAVSSGQRSGKDSSMELDPPSYTYTQLLQRVVDCLERTNPDFAEKKRFTMKPPQLMRGAMQDTHTHTITNTFYTYTHPLQQYTPNPHYPFNSGHEEDAVGELPGDLRHDAPQQRARLSVHDG